MKATPKQTTRYNGKVPVQFYAPPELVKDYRDAIARDERTLSQDLRRYMAERIAAEVDEERQAA